MVELFVPLFGVLLLILIPIGLLQYNFVIKPAMKKMDIWLEQQKDKNNK